MSVTEAKMLLDRSHIKVKLIGNVPLDQRRAWRWSLGDFYSPQEMQAMIIVMNDRVQEAKVTAG